MTQFDRLANDGGDLPRRRLSVGSMAPSDAPTASMYRLQLQDRNEMPVSGSQPIPVSPITSLPVRG